MMSEESRLNHIGLHRFGRDYLRAVALLMEGQDELFVLDVKYYLTCHSIELFFKAFLRKNGTTVKRLRQLGHNLCRLIIECQSLNTFGLLGIAQHHIDAITTINDYYKNKEFEYIATGAKQFPPLDILLEAASILDDRLNPRLELHD